MSWSSGIFSRLHNWVNDANASIGVVASRHDEEDDNLATGINNTLHKGGQNTPTADISWGGYKLTNLGTATTAAGAARLDQAQLQSATYAGAATGSANTYAINLSPAPASYVSGMTARFKPNYTSTGASTINVNGLGAKTLRLPNGDPLYRGALSVIQIAECVYDGAVFVLMNPVRDFSGALATVAAGSIANNSYTNIAFTFEEYDTASYHDNASNTTRMTIPEGVRYAQFHGMVQIEANGTGVRELRLQKNGVTQAYGEQAEGRAGLSAKLHLDTPVIQVSAGDYWELNVWQDSGVTLNLLYAIFAIQAVS